VTEEADKDSIYARPRVVDGIEKCSFYHTLEVPGHGLVEGEFDLRGRERQYLGSVDLRGKRVLEVGPASGYVSFYMERAGAQVVSLDLSEDHPWDIVPFASYDHRQVASERRGGIRRLNNAYWLCHRAFNSQARLVYGSAYDIPAAIGPVDVAVFCATLVHLHDPFRALQSALRITDEAVVVTEIVWNRYLLSYLLARLAGPSMLFLPDYRTRRFHDAWWFLTPGIVREFLGVLGFEETTLTHHLQKYRGRRRLAFTVTARRTRPATP
jgi:SAM-dependent methyltransferase